MNKTRKRQLEACDYVAYAEYKPVILFVKMLQYKPGLE